MGHAQQFLIIGHLDDRHAFKTLAAIE